MLHANRLAALALLAVLTAACSDSAPPPPYATAPVPETPAAVEEAVAPATAPPVDGLAVNVVADKAAFQEQAAAVSGDSIVSSGKAGFVLFGPYASMVAGSYQFTLFGSIEEVGAEPVIIDVVSNGKVIAEHRIDAAVMGPELARVDFTLPAQTDAMEFRARVVDGARVRIDRYTVQKSS